MSKCKTSFEVGGMGHSVKRKEDARFIRGQGKYIHESCISFLGDIKVHKFNPVRVETIIFGFNNLTEKVLLQYRVFFLLKQFLGV